ncbi:NADP-dependent oxidoreductase [Aeromonas bivalvium]|uniref:NADP-dependent oxidoreductase n=1 Tax=Aeromonas bivalvium TaxID=440079 RepID=UPI003D24665B
MNQAVNASQTTTPIINSTMQAAYIESYGEQSPLMIGTRPIPTPAADQVLIRIAAAGVNPVDFHIRNGLIADTNVHTLPLILGWDAAGTVVAKGADVTHHELGDEVFVFAPIDQQGAYAQYLAVDANLVVAKPNTINMTESAGVPLAATTAWQGLVTEGGLQAGQTVLIVGAAGGVGGFAVQMAKALGAHVIASASGKNQAYVTGLGADEFIDYKTTRFEDRVNQPDLVFVISSGGDLVKRALNVVRPGGTVVSTLDDVAAEEWDANQVTFKRMWVQPNADDLAIIANMIDQGQVKVRIDRVYTLAQASDALARSEAQLAVGKIVIEMI